MLANAGKLRRVTDDADSGHKLHDFFLATNMLFRKRYIVFLEHDCAVIINHLSLPDLSNAFKIMSAILAN